jgi:Flp pilus assembly protein TadD
LARAASLFALKREKEALTDIELVRGKYPDEPHAAYLYAMILARTDKIKEAKLVLSETASLLRNLDPEVIRNHAPSLLLMGISSFAQNDSMPRSAI